MAEAWPMAELEGKLPVCGAGRVCRISDPGRIRVAAVTEDAVLIRFIISVIWILENE